MSKKRRIGLALLGALELLFVGWVAVIVAVGVSEVAGIGWLCLFEGQPTDTANVYAWSLFLVGILTWAVLIVAVIVVAHRGKRRLAFLLPFGWLVAFTAVVALEAARVDEQPCSGGGGLF